MKLTKINYKSAVFFGAITLVMYLALGIYLWGQRDILLANGVVLSWAMAFVITPIIGAIVGYLAMLVVIVVYNLVARKYPISWAVSK